jgi:hypothetical protein
MEFGVNEVPSALGLHPSVVEDAHEDAPLKPIASSASQARRRRSLLFSV